VGCAWYHLLKLKEIRLPHFHLFIDLFDLMWVVCQIILVHVTQLVSQIVLQLSTLSVEDGYSELTRMATLSWPGWLTVAWWFVHKVTEDGKLHYSQVIKITVCLYHIVWWEFILDKVIIKCKSWFKFAARNIMWMVCDSIWICFEVWLYYCPTLRARCVMLPIMCPSIVCHVVISQKLNKIDP